MIIDLQRFETEIYPQILQRAKDKSRVIIFAAIDVDSVTACSILTVC